MRQMAALEALELVQLRAEAHFMILSSKMRASELTARLQAAPE